MKTIDVHELAKLHREGKVELVDVRTPVEFREVRAHGAKNVPLDQLDPHGLMKARNGSAEEPLYLICRSGNRSAKAAQKLMDAGYHEVYSVDGGTKAWEEAGHPVHRGKKAISLERQVRIAAGFLVLLGAVLGAFVSPYFIGLSAFVGAGLMFAGITDTCGMGMVLAKMPWNQCNAEASSCSA